MSQYKYYVVTFLEYEGWLDLIEHGSFDDIKHAEAYREDILKENDGIVQNTQVIQYVSDES